MKTWFECKVKFAHINERGKSVNKTETSLVDALSFTEAEAKIYEEYGQRVMGEFTVLTIAKSKIIDIFEYEDADTFYQAKVVYSVADADSGKEKKVTNLMLVQAKHVGEAFERIKDSLNNMLVTFEVPEIKESKVIEVFHHVVEEVPDNLTSISDYEENGGAEKMPDYSKTASSKPPQNPPIVYFNVDTIESSEEETKILAGVGSG